MLFGLQFSEKIPAQWLRLFYLYGPGQRQNSLLAQLDAAIDNKQSSFDMSPGDQLQRSKHSTCLYKRNKRIKLCQLNLMRERKAPTDETTQTKNTELVPMYK